MEKNINSYVGVLQEDKYVFTTHGLEELYMTHLVCGRQYTCSYA